MYSEDPLFYIAEVKTERINKIKRYNFLYTMEIVK